MKPKSSAPIVFSAMLDSGTLPSTSVFTRVTHVAAFLIDNIFSTLSLRGNSVLVTDISDHFHFLIDIFSIQS